MKNEVLIDPRHYHPADSIDWSTVRRIVITQRKNLGDAVLLVPILRILNRVAPLAQITVWCRGVAFPIFEGMKNVRTAAIPERASGLLWNDLFGESIDVFLDFQPSLAFRMWSRIRGARVRSGLPLPTGPCSLDTHGVPDCSGFVRHQIERNLDVLRRLGVLIDATEAHLTLSHLEARLVPPRQTSPYLLIHPGSRWMFKSLLKDQWIDLLLRVHNEFGMEIILTGGDSEMEISLGRTLESLPGVTNRIGQTTIHELISLIRHASAFVGVDTFAAHLAIGLDRPGVVIFGPSDSRRWGPRTTDRMEFIVASELDFPCQPCNLDGCGGGKVSDCLRSINLEFIMKKLHQSLARSGC